MSDSDGSLESRAAPAPAPAIDDWDLVGGVGSEQRLWRTRDPSDAEVPVPAPTPVPRRPVNTLTSRNGDGHYAISVCSFNTALVPELERSRSNPSSAAGALPGGTVGTPPSGHQNSLTQGLTARAERILDVCRTMHVCLLQEVWGPGVDVLTGGLSATHAIPSMLRSSNFPVLTNTVNTLAFYFSRTGGLWVAHSRAGGWAHDSSAQLLQNSPTAAQAGSSRDSAARSSSPAARQEAPQYPRYPPSKRPTPHLSLPSIPLTVPSLHTFSVPASGAAGVKSRTAVRALLLDASDAWGPGKRLLLFTLQLDAYDAVKRRLQLREVSQYIREVVLSLTSLIPLNAADDLANSGIIPGSDGRRRRSTSTPHTSTANAPLRGRRGRTDEFDMIDEYTQPSSGGLPGSGSVGAAAIGGVEFSGLDSVLEAGLPAAVVPRLQAIARSTGILVCGDFNISASGPEYPHLLNLFASTGNPGGVVDYFAPMDDGSGRADTVSGDGRNRLVKAGSVLGRVDYMLGGTRMAVQTIGNTDAARGSIALLNFLELEMVDGSVGVSAKGEEVSDHWPLIGYFVPKSV